MISLSLFTYQIFVRNCILMCIGVNDAKYYHIKEHLTSIDVCMCIYKIIHVYVACFLLVLASSLLVFIKFILSLENYLFIYFLTITIE